MRHSHVLVRQLIMKRVLASVWVQKRNGFYGSSSGMYVDLEELLPVLRKRYRHEFAHVYSCPRYNKCIRLSRDKQKEPNVALTEKLPVDEAWALFAAHVRML